MLQWDLSDTQLATSDTPGRIPTEGELLAIMVALLIHEDVGYEELKHGVLALHDENRAQVIEIVEYRLPEIARDFGRSDEIREPLVELTGIWMTRTDDGTPGERSVTN